MYTRSGLNIRRCSEMAVAESQILEVQKELDGHKEECYGHMKVIQELRGTKMQVQSKLPIWQFVFHIYLTVGTGRATPIEAGVLREVTQPEAGVGAGEARPGQV